MRTYFTANMVVATLIGSVVLQLPFLVLLLTGPHSPASDIGYLFFSPAIYLMEHLPPPLTLASSGSNYSAYATIGTLVALQLLLSVTVVFAVLVFLKWRKRSRIPLAQGRG